MYKRLLHLRIDNVVVNLSDYEFNFSEMNVLNRGLGFVPSFVRFSQSMLANDFSRFERRLQLHLHFAREDGSNETAAIDEIDEVFRPASTWVPKRLNTSISSFCQRLHDDAEKLLQRRPRPNLPTREVTALKSLRQRKEITIKPADKGGGICILNTTDYQTKIDTMLNDTSVYSPVERSDHDTVKGRADLLLNLLHSGGYLTDRQLRYLTDFEPRCPLFYGLPKVHKAGAPLRPIVSQINAPTSMINSLVDKLLTVAEKMVPNLFQDTTAFLKLLEKHRIFHPDSLLVTLDVSSLYTNIPHEEGIEFVSRFYEKTLHCWCRFHPGIPPIPVENLKFLMRFILTNCTFRFGDCFFRQKYGTTMGARFSVKFANIYMHVWFEHYLSVCQGPKFDFIGRLIDDVFTIWKYGQNEFDRFLLFLNSCHPTIKFTAEVSTTEIHFLDTVITVKNGELHSKVYTKPTDRKQFLFFSSCHPIHVKTAIPYAQAVRYRRNTDCDVQLREDLKILSSHFSNRGYPTNLINEAINRVMLLERCKTLEYTSKNTKRDRFKQLLGDRAFLPLITTYHAQFDYDSLKQVMKKRWKEFLAINDEIRDVFAAQFPILVFKRGRTIGNFLTSTTFAPPVSSIDTTLNALQVLLEESNQDRPVQKCYRPRCKCCDSILETTSVWNFDRSVQIAIDDRFNCNSSNVIYVIKCMRCHKQYVGQTDRLLKERLNNHRSDIKLKKPTAVGLHFNLEHHSFTDLRIFPIFYLESRDTHANRAVECAWMKRLNTIYPFGLNNNPLALL
jgi:hypothetical protein